ncbi:MAG: RNA polymerase sigma factor region1.1 domain-containing protein, partial [Alicyclobacillus shizuokensis]|nr:RNA polymerase sigma factor region1.1 domain-containing protein [Alicyclobacillus shizuokensis]
MKKEIQREAGDESREDTLQNAKNQLMELGKAKGFLTYGEITKRLAGLEQQDPDQLDELFDQLSELGIEVRGDHDEDEEEEESDGFDLGAHEG